VADCLDLLEFPTQSFGNPAAVVGRTVIDDNNLHLQLPILNLQQTLHTFQQCIGFIETRDNHTQQNPTIRFQPSFFHGINDFRSMFQVQNGSPGNDLKKYAKKAQGCQCPMHVDPGLSAGIMMVGA
jgi:hypothetical protein